MKNTCPENTDFEFSFVGKCPITTCQHCTKATQSGCMFLDRKDSADRLITNREIKYYKQGIFPELINIDQKSLDATVRQSQSRARSSICMQLYIDSLSETRNLEKHKYVPKYAIIHGVHNYLKQTFELYEDWMIFYMADEEAFSEISGSLSSVDITIAQALGRMTNKRYQSFCQALEMLKMYKEEEDGS